MVSVPFYSFTVQYSTRLFCLLEGSVRWERCQSSGRAGSGSLGSQPQSEPTSLQASVKPSCFAVGQEEGPVVSRVALDRASACGKRVAPSARPSVGGPSFGSFGRMQKLDLASLPLRTEALLSMGTRMSADPRRVCGYGVTEPEHSLRRRYDPRQAGLRERTGWLTVACIQSFSMTSLVVQRRNEDQ